MECVWSSVQADMRDIQSAEDGRTDRAMVCTHYLGGFAVCVGHDEVGGLDVMECVVWCVYGESTSSNKLNLVGKFDADDNRRWNVIYCIWYSVQIWYTYSDSHIRHVCLGVCHIEENNSLELSRLGGCYLVGLSNKHVLHVWVCVCSFAAKQYHQIFMRTCELEITNKPTVR